jgi:hypothetical protein
MRLKALENLEAARALLLLSPPLANAATTRAYYGAYQAAWVFLKALTGKIYMKPQNDGTWSFPHEQLGRHVFEANRARPSAKDDRQAIDFLRGQRVKADYYEDDVDPQLAAECIEKAASVIGRLLAQKTGP